VCITLLHIIVHWVLSLQRIQSKYKYMLSCCRYCRAPFTSAVQSIKFTILCTLVPFDTVAFCWNHFSVPTNRNILANPFHNIHTRVDHWSLPTFRLLFDMIFVWYNVLIFYRLSPEDGNKHFHFHIMISDKFANTWTGAWEVHRSTSLSKIVSSFQHLVWNLQCSVHLFRSFVCYIDR
jgi:hypothetical protein